VPTAATSSPFVNVHDVHCQLVHGHWAGHRTAERETLPRKRQLEALLEQLKEP
jgi:hypothetical protein